MSSFHFKYRRLRTEIAHFEAVGLATPDLEIDPCTNASFPHIVVSGRGDARTALDSELASRGLRRRVGVVVPTFGMVVPLLRCTPMIGMVPEKLVVDTPGLALFRPPVSVPDISLSLAWHRRRENDPALRHVADRLAAHLG